MSIFDDDGDRIDTDPFKSDKPKDNFNFDPGGYGRKLTNSLAGLPGREGGTLPGSLPDAGKATFQVSENRYQQPQLEPVSGVSATDPLKPIQVDTGKPAVQPALSPVKPEPIQPCDEARTASQTRMDRTITALNRLAEPKQQQSEDTGTLGLTIAKEARINPAQLNRLADADRQESASNGTLGLQAKEEAQFNPEILADALNQTAKAGRQHTGQTASLASRVSRESKMDHAEMEGIADSLNQGYETRHEYRPNIAESGYFLGKARSIKQRQNMLHTLGSIMNNYPDMAYGAVSDRAQAMTGWNNARFDPSTLNQYSAWERQRARDTITASLDAGKEVKWDPEMAKRQAYPILERFNRYYGYDAVGNSGFAGARFSVDILKDQLRDHMVKGTDPNYSHMEQTAKAMASLEKSGYGKTVTNIMGSVYTGTATIGQEASHTLMTMLEGYPPAEVIAFDLQTGYLANGDDLAGWASEIEANRRYARQRTQEVYGAWEAAKSMTRGMRGDAYNDLEYFTADPTRSALLRPDKLTGDFFEKAVPMMVSLALPTKGASAANLGKIGTLFTQFTWISSQAFNHAAAARVHTLISNPHRVDSNKQFQELLRNTHLTPEEARADFIQAEGRRAGVQAGFISLATVAGSGLFRHLTSSGTEGPVLEFFQDTVLNMMSSATDEAMKAPHEEIQQIIEKGGGEER